MSNYITKQDLYDVFGEDNIKQWSNLSGGSTEDTDRIDRAIARAEEDIENRFRDGTYSLPFAPIPLVIKDWCAKFAGLWLFEARPDYSKDPDQAEGFTQIRDLVDREIDAYTSGQRQLTCSKVSASGTSAAPEVT